MLPRLDHATSATIQAGMMIDAADGSVAAWTHMAAGGVAPPIISRVLTTSVRRVDDPPVTSGAAPPDRAPRPTRGGGRDRRRQGKFVS